jgi:hypothetical protein
MTQSGRQSTVRFPSSLRGRESIGLNGRASTRSPYRPCGADGAYAETPAAHGWHRRPSRGRSLCSRLYEGLQLQVKGSGAGSIPARSRCSSATGPNQSPCIRMIFAQELLWQAPKDRGGPSANHGASPEFRGRCPARFESQALHEGATTRRTRNFGAIAARRLRNRIFEQRIGLPIGQ